MIYNFNPKFKPNSYGNSSENSSKNEPKMNQKFLQKKLENLLKIEYKLNLINIAFDYEEYSNKTHGKKQILFNIFLGKNDGNIDPNVLSKIAEITGYTFKSNNIRSTENPNLNICHLLYEKYV